MVEYTVVATFGILLLTTGPGGNIVADLMQVVRNNFDGYSYAMSLSDWPEFAVEHDGPLSYGTIDYGQGDIGPGNSATGTPPAFVSDPTDWWLGEYRLWLEDTGLPQERIDVLTYPPALGDAMNSVRSFLEGGIPVLDGFPGGLPPSIGDIVSGFLPF